MTRRMSRYGAMILAVVLLVALLQRSCAEEGHDRALAASLASAV